MSSQQCKKLSIHDEDSRFLELVTNSFVSHDVVKRLRSNNFESIRPILQQLGVQALHDVISISFLELGMLYNTPHLDVIFKGKIRESQIKLAAIRSEVLAFNKELFRIDHELMGYPKYVAHVLLNGDSKVDPLSYHDWLEIQPGNAKLQAR